MIFAASVETYGCAVKAFSMTGAGDPKCPSNYEHGGSFPYGCGWKLLLVTGRNVLATVANSTF